MYQFRAAQHFLATAGAIAGAADTAGVRVKELPMVYEGRPLLQRRAPGSVSDDDAAVAAPAVEADEDEDLLLLLVRRRGFFCCCLLCM